ncbi:hypothetical protein P170DRAFT_73146 [Aspergillus steynii IBT 23096]|uniref:Uncharacterized protein n=1 Tax=Aspergillus steynii IBT 23096 TaxID=1392250 RepID=A0A2I2FR95_9EURO|nr:uncharacterized protein P170DRAFT_73146 [Aspergillus steynii IBT 23096]PLB43152.1 hypothetical protein P170DRAFT_73146 [Aspergillus steynii IBT 23096]
MSASLMRLYRSQLQTLKGTQGFSHQISPPLIPSSMCVSSGFQPAFLRNGALDLIQTTSLQACLLCTMPHAFTFRPLWFRVDAPKALNHIALLVWACLSCSTILFFYNDVCMFLELP